MRIAGVRLADGRSLWVDARDIDVRPLDRATVEIDGAPYDGEVFVTPEQAVTPLPPGTGVLVRATRNEADASCADLPGSEMPPLGAPVEVEQGAGRVTAIDPVLRTVEVTLANGELIELPLNAILDVQ